MHNYEASNSRGGRHLDNSEADMGKLWADERGRGRLGSQGRGRLGRGDSIQIPNLAMQVMPRKGEGYIYGGGG